MARGLAHPCMARAYSVILRDIPRDQPDRAGDLSVLPSWLLGAAECSTMPTILPSYSQAVEALTPILRGLPGIIVTIDGRGGVGKTTLGRYLAWQFNVTLIETDLFMIPAEDYLIHLDDQINRIIERRITTPLPVIVEGVSVLQLMKRINRTPGFKIYVTHSRPSTSAIMARKLAVYESDFSPSASADLVLGVEY